MLNIDEAINDFKKMAENARSEIIDGSDLEPQEKHYNSQLELYAKEKEQIAEWLEALKAYRQYIDLTEIPEQYKLGFQDGIIVGYNKAIDDFIKSEDYLMEKIKEEKAEVSIDYEWRKVVCLDDIRRMLHQGLLEIAEQLKAGVENENF